MSVLLNTSAGDIVIDLFSKECPVACENFLKLCTVKYYNQCLIYNVQPNYIVQSGDPTGTGKGGTSVFGIMNGSDQRFFGDEISKTVNPHYKQEQIGYVGMAHISGHENSNQSQFFITLRAEDMDHLKKTHTIFGIVAEGLETLTTLNELFCDEDGRPYQDVRILHTYILDDPFPNPRGLIVPPDSPQYEFPPEEKVKQRLTYSADPLAKTEEEGDENIEEKIKQKEARSRAIVLEMTGDLPDAEVKPPREVLFVCKLNPVTRDEDLELIFSRFGKIKSCEIIRDYLTGDSLNYAFIEYEDEESCIRAYEKMNNVLIDDRRIKVDFSQSVSKLWNRFLLKARNEPPASKLIKREADAANKKQDLSKYGPASGGSHHHHQHHNNISNDKGPNNNGQQHEKATYKKDTDRYQDRKPSRDDSRGRGKDKERERDRDRDRDREQEKRREYEYVKEEEKRRKDTKEEKDKSTRHRSEERKHDRHKSSRDDIRERRHDKEKYRQEDNNKYERSSDHQRESENKRRKRSRSRSPVNDHSTDRYGRHDRK